MSENDTFTSIDDVFRLVDREIWIVTSGRGGLVATWVSQASIDASRPVVVAGIAFNHATREFIDQSSRFALHLLRADQLDLAFLFATTSSNVVDKFADLSYRTTPHGTRILDDCLAWLDCRVVRRFDGGDRIYYWAAIEQGGRKQAGPPLREMQLIQSATADQLCALRASREFDIACQRPRLEQWLSESPRTQD